MKYFLVDKFTRTEMDVELVASIISTHPNLEKAFKEAYCNALKTGKIAIVTLTHMNQIEINPES